MGTRGAMGVRIDGVDKITYCHFDCYPSGLGENVATAVRRLLADPGLEGARRLAADLRVVTSAGKPTMGDKIKLSRWTDLGVAGKSENDWYCLTRHMQGDLLATLQAGVIVDGRDFMADSVFCEYAYVVNFDDGLFEAYRGFQDTKHNKGRYADMPQEERSKDYWPVALVGSFDLADIPRNWAEQAYPQEEEAGEKAS